MKFSRLGLLLALLTLLLVPQAFAQSTGARLALKGYDPVLLIDGQEKEGAQDHEVAHGGFLYRFVSAETQARFEEDPERYGIQGNGRCTTMPEARANPSIFTVHEGHIYAFGTADCKMQFLANPDLYLKDEAEAAKVAVLVFNGVELLDFAGPGEVFAAAGHGRAFDVFTVGLSKEPVLSQGFVTITPQYALDESPRPDILVVPGGGVRSILNSERAMGWIRETAQNAYVLSVCNGAFVLADAGLLEGKEATTHHGSLEALTQHASNTVVHADRRYVDNGRVITAAGVSAGIDASLHLVERLLGAGMADGTAAYMEYERRPEKDGVRRASVGTR